MRDIENRKDVKQMVDSFYNLLRKDERLGFIFDGVAKVDWPEHLPRLYDFWESILFDKQLFSGNPLQKHALLNQKEKLTKEDFDNWIRIFMTNIDNQFQGVITEKAKQRADSIAVVLKTKIVYS